MRRPNTARRSLVILAAFAVSATALAQDSDIGGLVVCPAVVDGKPQGAADHFDSVMKLYGHLRFLRLPAADKAEVVWKRDGGALYQDELPLPAGTTSLTVSFDMGARGGFPADRYELVIIRAGRTVGRKAFTVGDAGVTEVATDPPPAEDPGDATVGGAGGTEVVTDPPPAEDSGDPAEDEEYEEEIDDDPQVYFGPPLPDGVDPFASDASQPDAPAETTEPVDVGTDIEPLFGETSSETTPKTSSEANSLVVCSDFRDGKAVGAGASFEKPASLWVVFTYEGLEPDSRVVVIWRRAGTVVFRHKTNLAGSGAQEFRLLASEAEGGLPPGEYDVVARSKQVNLAKQTFTIE